MNLEEIRARIEKEKDSYSKREWISLTGVTPQIIGNIHGVTRQNPSLEYVIAVAVAVGKPISYFLWGDSGPRSKPQNCCLVDLKHFQRHSKRFDLHQKLDDILTSKEQRTMEAIELNINEFHEKIMDKRRARGKARKKQYATVKSEALIGSQ